MVSKKCKIIYSLDVSKERVRCLIEDIKHLFEENCSVLADFF